MPLPTLTLEEIGAAFAARQPTILPRESRRHAAVAMIFSSGAEGAEILFIERAELDGDPWSGDLGFPGGKVESWDAGPRQAAERETREEIGLDLGGGAFLGRLDDIAGATLPVHVSCFLFRVDDPPPFLLGDEVAQAFWVPLSVLLDPARRIEAMVPFRGELIARPAIDLLGPDRRVLWGLTYRLVMQFFSIMRELG